MLTFLGGGSGRYRLGLFIICCRLEHLLDIVYMLTLHVVADLRVRIKLVIQTGNIRLSERRTLNTVQNIVNGLCQIFAVYNGYAFISDIYIFKRASFS